MNMNAVEEPQKKKSVSVRVYPAGGDTLHTGGIYWPWTFPLFLILGHTVCQLMYAGSKSQNLVQVLNQDSLEACSFFVYCCKQTKTFQKRASQL